MNAFVTLPRYVFFTKWCKNNDIILNRKWRILHGTREVRLKSFIIYYLIVLTTVCDGWQCERVQPCLVMSKPLPDWLETRVNDMVTELNLRVKVVSSSQDPCPCVCLHILLYLSVSVSLCSSLCHSVFLSPLSDWLINRKISSVFKLYFFMFITFWADT